MHHCVLTKQSGIFKQFTKETEQQCVSVSFSTAAEAQCSAAAVLNDKSLKREEKCPIHLSDLGQFYQVDSDP